MNNNVLKFILIFCLVLITSPVSAQPQQFEMQIQLGHTSDINSITFSPDYEYLASGGEDGLIKIWNANTGRVIRTIKAHHSPITTVKFSPERRFILSVSESGEILIWNIETGKLQAKMTNFDSPVSAVTFSGQRKYLVAGHENGDLTIMSYRTGNKLDTIKTYGSKITALQFASDHQHMVSATVNGELKLWNIANRRLVKIFQIKDASEVTAFALSPDGKQLVSGHIRPLPYLYTDSPYPHHTLRVWDIDTGLLLRTYPGHSWVKSIGFSTDGQHLYSIDTHGKLQKRHVFTNQVQFFQVHAKGVASPVAFSPAGERLVFADNSRNRLQMWDIQKARIVRHFSGYYAPIYSVSTSSDAKYIVTSGGTLFGQESEAHLWDRISGQMIQTYKGHRHPIHSVVFSPDNRYLVTASWDRTLKVWHRDSGKNMQTLIGHRGFVNQVTFSPQGKYIASASSDGTVKLWNALEGKLIRTFNHRHEVMHVAFSANGLNLITGGLDGNVNVWDTFQGFHLKTMTRFDKSPIHHMAIAPDGRHIAIVIGASLYVHELSTGRVIQTLPYKSPIKAVAFSPDSRHVLASGQDKTIKLWNISGQLLYRFSGHNATSLAFVPNHHQIVSGDITGRMMLWDTLTGKRLYTSLANYKQDYVTWTPDGFFTASPQGQKELLHSVAGLEIYSIVPALAKFNRPEEIQKRASFRSVLR